MAHFESTLERDLFLLLEFDPNVRFFEEQPVRIEYQDEQGKQRSYTPDVLVTYHSTLDAPWPHRPELLEVKYESELKAKAQELQPKFEAAEAYVLRHDWQFRVATERDIRTPRLQNVRLLLPYRTALADELSEARLLHFLDEEGPQELDALLRAVASTDEARAVALPSVWRLLATGTVFADLDQPIGLRTLLHLYAADP
jgi:hypothetical protein